MVHRAWSRGGTGLRMAPYLVQGRRSIASDVQRVRVGVGNVMISTPGRCLAILQQTEVDLGRQLGALGLVVLWGAGQLTQLDTRYQVEGILRELGGFGSCQRPWDLVLVTDTPVEEVEARARALLDPEYEVVTREDVKLQSTADKENQMLAAATAVVPAKELVARLVLLLRHCLQTQPSSKVLVTTPTTYTAALYARLCMALGLPALEVHSRLSARLRSRNLEEVRRRRTGVIFTTQRTLPVLLSKYLDTKTISLAVQVHLYADASTAAWTMPSSRMDLRHVPPTLSLLCPWEKGLAEEATRIWPPGTPSDGRTPDHNQDNRPSAHVGPPTASPAGPDVCPLPPPFSSSSSFPGDVSLDPNKAQPQGIQAEEKLCPTHQLIGNMLLSAWGGGTQGDLKTRPRSKELKELQKEILDVLHLGSVRMERLRFAAYVSLLGYYKEIAPREEWTQVEVVEAANQYVTTVLGLPHPPAINRSTAMKLGLHLVAGLQVEHTVESRRFSLKLRGLKRMEG